MSTLHPTPFELEQFHAGERLNPGTARVADHVATCSRCQSVLRSLAQLRAEFLSAKPPEVFVENLRHTPRLVVPEKRRPWHPIRIAWPMLATTLLALVLLQTETGLFTPRLTSEAEPSAPRLGTTPELTRKGGCSLCVVRRRDGDQSLVGAPVSIRAGDELRLQFHRTSKGRVRAGILTDDDQWIPWFDSEVEAGTHTPEATLRVDGDPSSGVILLGSPDQVELARQRRPGAVVEMAALIWTEQP